MTEVSGSGKGPAEGEGGRRLRKEEFLKLYSQGSGWSLRYVDARTESYPVRNKKRSLLRLRKEKEHSRMTEGKDEGLRDEGPSPDERAPVRRGAINKGLSMNRNIAYIRGKTETEGERGNLLSVPDSLRDKPKTLDN